MRAAFAACALLLLGSTATVAAAPDWTVEETSSVGFVARQSGAEVEGRFEEFTAGIAFDPAQLESSRVMVEIDIDSVNSESSDRDSTIRSAALFDVATWPTARFEAERFEQTGENLYTAHGRLTMRDVTREVALPFELTISDHPSETDALQARAAGELTVLRLDYGVGQGQWQDTSVVANEVVIRIEIIAKRPKT